MDKQKRVVIKVNRNNQFDLFGGQPSVKPVSKKISTTGRVFNDPDPHDIYLSVARLEDHLKQAGIKAPFVIRELLQSQDWSTIEARYATSGRAPYAPICMVGLILYGILQGVSSLRGLEKFARVDLGCMWVTGGICPDHANIGRFINQHDDFLSSELFQGLTAEILKKNQSAGEFVAGDGTVIEAACSHYHLLKEEATRKQLDKAQEELNTSPVDKNKQAKLEYAQQVHDVLQKRIMACKKKGKKTDSLCISGMEPEAVVQKQKRGRGVCPSYKPVVLANESRVVVAMDVHPSNENAVLPGLLDQCQMITQGAINELALDAGFHCDQVISECITRDISLLCPEGKQAGKPKQSKKKILKGEFIYSEEKDAYQCPANQMLYPTEHYKGNDQAAPYIKYGNKAACQACSIKDQCTVSQQGRSIKRYASDEKKEALKQVMQQPKAKQRYQQRQAMVEPVFSDLRRLGLTRFKRKGLKGVKREFALFILAYNLSRAVVAMSTVYFIYLIHYRVLKRFAA